MTVSRRSFFTLAAAVPMAAPAIARAAAQAISPSVTGEAAYFEGIDLSGNTGWIGPSTGTAPGVLTFQDAARTPSGLRASYIQSFGDAAPSAPASIDQQMIDHDIVDMSAPVCACDFARAA